MIDGVDSGPRGYEALSRASAYRRGAILDCFADADLDVTDGPDLGAIDSMQAPPRRRGAVPACPTSFRTVHWVR